MDLREWLAIEPVVLEGAACVGEDPEMFYPPTGFRNAPVTDAAKAVCNRCPVREKCLDAAMKEEGKQGQYERYGVRGGLTAKERRALSGYEPSKKMPEARDPKEINHGTVGGYTTHRTRGVPPCDECRAAVAEYQRAKRRRSA